MIAENIFKNILHNVNSEVVSWGDISDRSQNLLSQDLPPDNILTIIGIEYFRAKESLLYYYRLRFKETPKTLVLYKNWYEKISRSLGCNIEEWIGAKIGFKVREHVIERIGGCLKSLNIISVSKNAEK